MHKRFEKLVVKTKLPLMLFVDFMAICIGGRITDEREIFGNRRNYSALATDDVITVSMLEEESDLETKDDLIEPLSMYFGAMLLGAEAEVSTVWNSCVPDANFFKKHLPSEKYLVEMTDLICSESCLTLADLLEVSQSLAAETRAASVLMEDANFRKIFPGIQTKYGDYGFIRHRSGAEIRTSWYDREFLDSYGYETPSPVSGIIQEWMKELRMEYEEPFGQKFRVAKWQLAKALNKVPQPDKIRVYEWVIETLFKIEDYHDSRGGTYLPDRLECEFANCILTVDTDSNFELIQC